MPTYAEYGAQRERAARKAAQDAELARRHAAFDLQVKDGTTKRGEWKGMKYERMQFAIVTASEAYRKGYDDIDWNRERNPSDSPDSPPGV